MAVMSNFGKVSVGVGKTLQVVDGQKYVTLQAEYDAYKISSQAAFDVSMNELRESKDASIAAIQGDYDELNSQYSSLSNQYDVLDASLQRLDASYESLEGNYQSLQTEYGVLDASYSSLQSDYGILDSSYSTLSELYQSFDSSYQALQNECNQKDSSIADLQNERIKLFSRNFGDYEIPAGITSIGANMFYNSNLKSIIIPEGVTYIGLEAFSNTNIETVEIPSSVTTMGKYAFRNCIKLKTAIWKTTSVNSTDSVFYGCSALESISLPDGLPKIYTNMFNSCKSLKSIEIPSSVTEIGYAAYQEIYTENLTITIPAAVTNIESQAFAKIRNIKWIKVLNPIPATLGNNVITTWTGSYYSSPNVKIYVPDESVDAYKGATNWKTYANNIYPMSEFTE